MVDVPAHNCNTDRINAQYNEAISLDNSNDKYDAELHNLWLNRVNASCTRALEHLDANALDCPNFPKIKAIFEGYVPVHFSRKYAKSITKWKLIDSDNDYMMRYVNALTTHASLVRMHHYLRNYDIRTAFPQEYIRIRMRILDNNLLPELEDYYSNFSKANFYDGLPGNYQLGIVL